MNTPCEKLEIHIFIEHPQFFSKRRTKISKPGIPHLWDRRFFAYITFYCSARKRCRIELILAKINNRFAILNFFRIRPRQVTAHFLRMQRNKKLKFDLLMHVGKYVCLLANYGHLLWSQWKVWRPQFAYCDVSFTRFLFLKILIYVSLFYCAQICLFNIHFTRTIVVIFFFFLKTILAWNITSIYYLFGNLVCYI